MKTPFLLFSISCIGILAGCSSTQPPTTSDKYDCSTPEYYENVKLEKQVSFTWDEARSAYTVEIPELCVKLIAPPRNTTLDITSRKESPYLTEKDISIKNNSLFVGGYTYRFLDKKATETLDEAVQKRFRIRFKDDDIRTYQDQAYCVIATGQPSNLYARPQIAEKADEDTHYTLIRPVDINQNLTVKALWEIEFYLSSAVEDFWYYYSNHCGALYPIQWEGFDATRPYGILYTDQHPTRYFFYPEVIWQDLDSHLFANVILQYSD